MWQTTYDDAGEYTATVTVTDGFSNVSQDVKITVLNVNRPPVLASIGAISAVEGINNLNKLRDNLASLIDLKSAIPRLDSEEHYKTAYLKGMKICWIRWFVL